MRVTLKEIAAKCGVTKTTVSMALRNCGRVSPARREEIQRLAREMGHVPDPFLSQLTAYRRRKEAVQERGRMAWVNHWPQPERLLQFKEFALYFKAARQAARRLGYQLDAAVWPPGMSARDFEQTLLDQGVLGLLIPPHPPGVEWGDFAWDRFSLMRFGMAVQQPDSNLVTADHQLAMVLAMTRIHEHGYRRIGLILNRLHDCSMGGNWTGGYLWAQKLLKLDPVPVLGRDLRPTPRGLAQYKAALGKWVEQYRLEAILTDTRQVPGLLGELGWRIPEEIAVAGTTVYDLPLDSGIDQHPETIGAIAAEMLIKQISLNEKGEPANPCRILVESRWREGKSLPPLRHPAGEKRKVA